MQDAQQQPGTPVVQPPAYYDNADTLDLVALSKMTRRRKSRHRIIVISVFLALIIAAGVVFYMLDTTGTVTTYQTVAATQGNLVLTAVATGSIQANTYEANLTASGTIVAIYVRMGQQVKAGQKLAQLNTTALEDQLKIAQIQLQQADAAGNWDAIQIAQIQVNEAQDNLNAATLTAPHAGVITAINGSVGSMPGRGSATSGSSGFIEITDLSALNVLLNVNEADMGHVAPGDPVQFTVDAYGNRSFRGQVSAITQNGQTNNSIVTYPVLVSVNSSNARGAAWPTGDCAGADRGEEYLWPEWNRSSWSDCAL